MRLRPVDQCATDLPLTFANRTMTTHMTKHQRSADLSVGAAMSTPTICLRMEACGLSETGDVRPHNEDRFLVDGALGLAAVADGMGGHLSGEIASSQTLAALARSLATPVHPSVTVPAADPDATEVDVRWRSSALLRRAVNDANATVFQENCARGHGEGTGMGSTLTGLQFVPALGVIVSFHVGDSRLYRYRDGTLIQLTRDQTAYQVALESGASGALPPSNLLLQAIGPAAEVAPDLACHALNDGDLFLLCSDGLHGWVPHGRMDALLAGAGDLHEACTALLGLARQYASRDNVTALLVRFAAAPAPAEKKVQSVASDRSGPA